MAVEKEKTSFREAQKDPEKFNLQAEILLAVYSRLIELNKAQLSILPSQTKEESRLIVGFVNSYSEKTIQEKITILKDDPYKNLRYFQIWAEILAHPSGESCFSGDQFVLVQDHQGKTRYLPGHHKINKDERELFNGSAFAFKVKEGLLSRDCFPEQMGGIIFIEIEPGKASGEFQKLVENDASAIKILSALATSHVGWKFCSWNQDDNRYRLLQRVGVVFIKTRPQITPPPVQPYMIDSPVIIFEKATNLYGIFGKEGWDNLPLF